MAETAFGEEYLLDPPIHFKKCNVEIKSSKDKYAL